MSLGHLSLLDRPDARNLAGTGLTIRVLNVVKIPRMSPSCSFDVALLPLGIVFRNCLAGIKNNRKWASLPSRPRMERGRVVSLDGIIAHEAVVDIPDEQKRRAFLDALIAALEDMGAFEP